MGVGLAEEVTGQQKKTLVFLSVCIFFISIGEGMTTPAIPLLGKQLGASYSEIGFFMTGFSVSYALTAIAAGRLSDRFGRKKLLLCSLGLCLAAALGYIWTTSPAGLLLFRTIEGLAKGSMVTVAEAIITDNTVRSNRDRETGRFASAYGLGMVCGNLLGGIIMEYLGLRLVFPFYPTLVSLLILATVFVLADSYQGGSGEWNATERKALLAEIKKLWPICFVGFAFTGYLYTVSGFLSMVAAFFQVSFLGTGIVFALFWCCRFFAFAGAGTLSQKTGRKRMFLLGISLVVLSAAVFVAARNVWFLLTAVILGGIGTGIMYPLSVAHIADQASPEHRGFAMGFWELTAALGMIVQTALSGILGELGGVHLTYALSLAVALLAVVVIGVFIENKPLPGNNVTRSV